MYKKTYSFSEFSFAMTQSCSVNKKVGENLSAMATELVEKDCAPATARNCELLFRC